MSSDEMGVLKKLIDDMNTFLRLIINKEATIEIGSIYPIEEFYPYSGELDVVLKLKETKYCLANNITLFDLEQIVLPIFEKALNNNLQMPVTISDLGLELNNYWFKQSQESVDIQRLTEPFELFECNDTSSTGTHTFLYNKNKACFLQVSTKYLYFFSSDEDVMSYNEWLSFYKVIYRGEVRANSIKKWVIDLKDLIKEFRCLM